MEKIININFQGRIIPIEESAYDQLRKYVDSLRAHFAGEESSEEIIGDIENRIAELLGDRLKQGVNCIVADDLRLVIASIGKLEDIEAAEGEEHKAHSANERLPDDEPVLTGRFYRSADDKVIAGVCSGIAIRMGVDPVIVRILFVLLFGAIFWVYVLLWIIVPSQSIRYRVVRKLYRNPDDRMISGVCGGLAAYFSVPGWIPRLIFVLPLIAGLASNGIYAFWWEWPWIWGPGIFAGSIGGTLFILYIVLWIALPYASSSTHKMELRGERIDINSIRAATQARVNTGLGASPANSGGLGRVLVILFKAFFFFVFGIVAISLFAALIALLFAGTVALPFAGFLFEGWEQYTLVSVGLALTLGIPVLAFIIWAVRRLMGVRSRRHYLGYVFAGLWLTGITCTLVIAGIVTNNFSSRSVVEETIPLTQPAGGAMFVNVSDRQGRSYLSRHREWFADWDDKDAPFRYISDDSLWLNTVKLSIEQSPDSSFHVYETRASRGNHSQQAEELANHISFNIEQRDSLLTLPRGFTINKSDKFRNQQVLVTIEVPVGKKLQLGRGLNDYQWLDLHIGRNNYVVHRERHRYRYHSNRDYIMTDSGLKMVEDTTETVTEYY